MSTIPNGATIHPYSALPRNSCLFAASVFETLTSISSPWLSNSDRKELKEARKDFWRDDYDGDQCSEPDVHPYEPTEAQDAARDRLYDSVCEKLVASYVPETATAVATEHTGGVPSRYPLQHTEEEERILAIFRQNIADRKVKDLTTMVLQHKVQILEHDGDRYPMGYSLLIQLLHRCAPEFDRFPESRVPYDPATEDDKVYNTIVVRWENIVLVDDITVSLGLPRPNRKSAAFWRDGDGVPRVSTDKEMSRCYDMLRKAKCFVYPTTPAFLNPHRYLCAALALARLSEEEGRKKVEEIAEIMGQLKQACLEAMLGDGDVRKCAEEWFSSIGRQIV